MPRGHRLDAPGALHHVMARGIDGEAIFRDDRDRDAFLDRIGRAVAQGRVEVFAWALMTNHVHLLVGTGRWPLSRTMRCLLTGHAIAFNRRHGRVGYVFQGRYRSILCDRDAYFLELVRYIHLNPIRAGIRGTLADLDEDPYTGHSALIGRSPRPWQATGQVLLSFGATRARALGRYRSFLAEGLRHPPATDLSGGGLVRSAGGWAAVSELRRAREVHVADERILGGPAFVAKVMNEAPATRHRRPVSPDALGDLVRVVCEERHVPSSVILAGGRLSRSGVAARDEIARRWVVDLGGSGRELGLLLGITAASAYRCARRAEHGGREASPGRLSEEPSGQRK